MRRLGFNLRLFFGAIGFILLFLLLFIGIFLSLGVFSLGLIVFPASLLGIFDVLIITTNLGLPVLAAAGLGAVMLGGGLCIAMAFACMGALSRYNSFCKGTEWRKRRLDDEKN